METNRENGEEQGYWRKWYFSLMVFLFLQILLYSYLTNYLQ